MLWRLFVKRTVSMLQIREKIHYFIYFIQYKSFTVLNGWTVLCRSYSGTTAKETSKKMSEEACKALAIKLHANNKGKRSSVERYYAGQRNNGKEALLNGTMQVKQWEQR